MHAALDAGVTLIDTADAYARDEAEFGHNEELVADGAALVRRAADVLVATKGGHTRRGTRLGAGRVAGLPAPGVRGVAAAAARRRDRALPVPPARPGDAVGGVDGRAAVAADDGLVRMVGISNADIAQIDAARAIVGDALVSVQNQFSPGLPLLGRRAGALRGGRAGLAAVEPVRRGVGGRLAGRRGARVRRGGRRARRLGVPGDAGVAPRAGRRRRCPIPGASRPASIIDSAAAADLTLSPDQLARLERPRLDAALPAE